MSSHNALVTTIQTALSSEAESPKATNVGERKAEERSVEAINRLYKEMEGALGAGLRGSLYAAFRIGVVAKAFQDAAPHKGKTEAINQLALNPDLRVSVAQLYRFVSLVKKLPERLGIEPQKILNARKNEFLLLVGDLSLQQALKLLSPAKAMREEQDVNQSLEEDTPETQRPHRSKKNTKKAIDHCLTSKVLLSVAAKFLGHIDNDPCGSTDTKHHISGARTWTPSEDSLLVDEAWRNRLFLHPPISNAAPFLERAVNAVNSGIATEAVALVAAEMDAPHLAILQPFAKGFLHKRPQFAVPSGEIIVPQWPYMVVLLTHDQTRTIPFAVAFGHLADIYFPHRF